MILHFLFISAWTFASQKSFQTGLIFASKARSLPFGVEHLKRTNTLAYIVWGVSDDEDKF